MTYYCAYCDRTPCICEPGILSDRGTHRKQMTYENSDNVSDKWCWFFEDDERFKVCDTEQEAHAQARSAIDDDHEDGTEIEYVIGRPCHPLDTISDYPRLLGERAFEQADEWCGEETGAEDWTMDITDDDKRALGYLIIDFLRKNAAVQWWGLNQESKTTHKYVAGSAR